MLLKSILHPRLLQKSLDIFGNVIFLYISLGMLQESLESLEVLYFSILLWGYSRSLQVSWEMLHFSISLWTAPEDSLDVFEDVTFFLNGSPKILVKLLLLPSLFSNPKL